VDLKKKFAKGVALFAVAAVLNACGASPEVLEDDTRPVAQGALPLRFVLAQDAPLSWGSGDNRFDVVQALQDAADVWNRASGFVIIEFEGARASIVSNTFSRDETSRDGRNGLYIFEEFGDTRVSLGADAPTDILGLCVSRGFESDIALTLMARVRRTSGGTDTEKEVKASDLLQNQWSQDAFDFMSVAIHEFGHALGLPHDTTDEQSVMWYQGLAVGRVNRGLSASDKARLAQALERRFRFTVEIEPTTDPDPTRN
jgi:hypothetical protein